MQQKLHKTANFPKTQFSITISGNLKIKFIQVFPLSIDCDKKLYIAFTNHMRYIIVPSLLAGRGLGVGFLYLTQLRTAIKITYLNRIPDPDIAELKYEIPKKIS